MIVHANRRVIREEDQAGSWNLKEEGSSLAHPEKLNKRPSRNPNPILEFQL